MGCENLVLQMKGRQKSTPKFRFCKSLVVILSIIHNFRVCSVIRVMQQAGQNARTVTSSQGGYGYGNPHDKRIDEAGPVKADTMLGRLPVMISASVLRSTPIAQLCLITQFGQVPDRLLSGQAANRPQGYSMILLEHKSHEIA